MSKEKTQLLEELHAPGRINFPPRRVIVRGYDDLWQADLVDMRNYVDTGHQYILAVIDTLSKYAWSVALETKSGREVTTKRGINHYSTYSVMKASIVERWNHTFKTEMWKQFTLNGNYKWRAMLQELVDAYNARRHRTGRRHFTERPSCFRAKQLATSMILRKIYRLET
ncbi:uncharacterized protein [Prorops nasuta]|uniref:uncharacterized protein n=1 Tax=Prorops nasuta TaxID=863751 RepID=UPI0034CD0F5E